MDRDAGSIAGIAPDLALFEVGRVEATADPSTLAAGATVAQDDRVELAWTIRLDARFDESAQ